VTAPKHNRFATLLTPSRTAIVAFSQYSRRCGSQASIAVATGGAVAPPRIGMNRERISAEIVALTTVETLNFLGACRRSGWRGLNGVNHNSLFPIFRRCGVNGIKVDPFRRKLSQIFCQRSRPVR